MTIAAKEKIDSIVSVLSQENELAPVLNTSAQSFIRDNIFLFTEESKNFVNKNGWDTFIAIDEVDPNSLLSKLNTGGKNYSNLLNMTTLEKSQIVPKINLFKVIVDGTKRRHTRQIPIPFPDSSKENIQSLISSRGQRGDDIAIKSFTFDFKNQNPFGAGRMVDCRLVLTMLSGASLTKTRITSSFDKTGRLIEDTFTFADLLVRNNRINPEKFDSDYYEIKAVVGYETPPGNQIQHLRGDLSNNQVSMLLMLIDYDISFQQNGVIQLTLDYKARIEQVLDSPITYNIFKETEIKVDPSLNVKLSDIQKDLVSINERTEGITRELAVATVADAVGLPSLAGIEKQQPILGRDVFLAAGEVNVEAAGLVANYQPPTTDQLLQRKRNDALKLLEEFSVQKRDKTDQYNTLNNKRLFLSAKNRVKKFNQLLTNMYRKGLIRRFVIKKTDLLLFGPAFDAALQKERENLYGSANVAELPLVDILDPLAAEARTQRLQASADLQSKIKSGQNVSTDSPFEVESNIDAIATEIGAKADLTSADISGKLELTLNNRADSYSEDKGDKIIYWFYYGDLINEAFKLNDVHLRMLDDHIVPTLGGFTLTDPQNNVVSKDINIADVPISLELFIEFFKQNVIDTARDNYPALDFIRDTTQRLVSPAINTETFGVTQKETRTFKVTTFELPASIDSGGEISEPITNGFLGALPIDEVPAAFQTKFKGFVGSRVGLNPILGQFGNNALLARRSPRHIYSYIMFYGNSTETVLNWRGDPERDALRGVYHFYIGSDRGLIKEVNFAKSQRPYVAEMMAERAQRAGDRNAELWRNFEANISMIGNSLLKPGSYLYINPTVAGLGNPSSRNALSRKLGLGGYYFVLESSNSITEAGWNTQIKAVWQSNPPVRN